MRTVAFHARYLFIEWIVWKIYRFLFIKEKYCCYGVKKKKRHCIKACFKYIFQNHPEVNLSPTSFKIISAVSAVTGCNPDQQVPEFKKQCHARAVFCFPLAPLLSLFMSSFSDGFPANPRQEIQRGSRVPTAHSEPNASLQPAGLQVQLLLLDVWVGAPPARILMHSHKKIKIKNSTLPAPWYISPPEEESKYRIFCVVVPLWEVFLFYVQVNLLVH